MPQARQRPCSCAWVRPDAPQMQQSAELLAPPGSGYISLLPFPKRKPQGWEEGPPATHTHRHKASITSHDPELCVRSVSYRVINAGPKWEVTERPWEPRKGGPGTSIEAMQVRTRDGSCGSYEADKTQLLVTVRSLAGSQNFFYAYWERRARQRPSANLMEP